MIRVLFDAFHHMMPGHRIGSNIVVGGYQTNYGRYTPGDCYHPNGLAVLQSDLAAAYDIRLLTAPYSEMSLFDADILFVANPDYPLYEGSTPYRWTPEDVDALLAFAERGGGVLLLVNSFLSRPDFWEENFDHERVSLLFDRLGLRWDPNFMSDDQTIELAESGPYSVGYGQGGRVFNASLPDNIAPLLTREGQIYGFETAIGQGRLIVIGDAGLVSNGLMCFPGFDNAAFMRDVFTRLTPSWCRQPVAKWDYRGFGHISAAPSKAGLNEDIIRSLRPDARWYVDHHYRHLTWEGQGITGAGAEIWRQLPVAVGDNTQSRLTTELHWLSLDHDGGGPAFPIELTINATRHDAWTDIHFIGRSQSREVKWADLCHDVERMRPGGEVEHIHSVFEMRLTLDAKGAKKAVRWSQGQTLWARNPNAVHYGYEIVLASASGVVAPAAG
jgi:hypothetical protein